MSGAPPPPLDPKQQTELYVELWKQTVQVQMHFNDIEMKVRTAAVTLLTFVIGGASLALREEMMIHLWVDIPLASMTLFLGIVLWGVFFVLDQWWYHQLLLGAVKHGEALETELQTALPKAGLSQQIRASSPKEIKLLGVEMFVLKSTHKMNLFYGSVTALLLAGAVTIWVADAFA